MRIAILKIVVVLLAAGSGDTRPQRTGKAASTSPEGWRPTVATKSTAMIQGENRYRNSGSNNKAYAGYYQGPIIPISSSSSSYSSSFQYKKQSNPSSVLRARSISGYTSIRAKQAGSKSDSTLRHNAKPTEGSMTPAKYDGFASSNTPVKVGSDFVPWRAIGRVREETSLSQVDRIWSTAGNHGTVQDGVPPSPSRKASNWIGSAPVSGWISSRRSIPLYIPTKNDKISDPKPRRHFLDHDETRRKAVLAKNPSNRFIPLKSLQLKNVQGKSSSDSSKTRENNVKNTFHKTFVPMKPLNSHTGDKNASSHGRLLVLPAELKNWPNGAVQNVEDLYNYERYTMTMGQETKAKNSSKLSQKPEKDPTVEAGQEETIQWLKIPAFTGDSSHVAEEDDFGNTSDTFEPVYNNLEPNSALEQEDKWIIVKPPSISQYEEASGWPSSVDKRPTFNPLTHVQQDTVVHILNNGNKPNVTVTEMKDPPLKLTNDDTATRPNVHIMFTSQKEDQEVKVPEDSPVIPQAALNDGCPTIMINSITRINNTIESKEGCTDLNIVINSQILSTNVLNHVVADDPLLPDPEANDKYVGDPSEDSHLASTDYSLVSTSGYGQQYGNPAQDQPEVAQESQVSTVVFQGTQISIGQSVDGEPEAEVVQEDPVSNVDPPASGVAEDVSGGGSSAADSPAVPVGQSNDAISSVNLPSIPGGASLPARPSIPGPASQGTGNTALAPVGAANSNDDDEEFDYSPDSFFESAASAFAYFTFLNPLHYGFFSLAAAPFAAMAAGVLGVAAFLFPWAFPRVFGLGRSSSDLVTIRFRPSLDEVVRRSVHKYERLNDWKGKRRKKKRCSPANGSDRHLKDLQEMDQSLRTVATQLLNATSPSDLPKVIERSTTTSTKKTSPNPEVQHLDEKSTTKVSSPDVNTAGTMVSFGRPINSKFSYFESSHPGQAMALTEEELEREMSSTKTTSVLKSQQTTTGGISTWILLNPPSTTVKPGDEKKGSQGQTEVRLTTKPGSSTVVTTAMPKIKSPEKVTLETLHQETSTTGSTAVEKQTTGTRKPTNATRKATPTVQVDKITESMEKISSSSFTTAKLPPTTTLSSIIEGKIDVVPPTTSKPQVVRTTQKPKSTTLNIFKSTISVKAHRPTRPPRPKPLNPKRITTTKPDVKVNSAATSKIEKVTFRPVQMVTTAKPRPETTERPMFITKIKASVVMNSEKPSSTPPSTSVLTTLNFNSTAKLNFSGTDLVEVPVKSTPPASKVNNVLKVQLKKSNESTKVEFEPIKVNTTVLKIEKEATVIKVDTPQAENSKVDLDLHPEVTKIDTESTTLSSTTVASSTTTKRPRGYGHKKKKKNKKRKNAVRNSSTPSFSIGTTASTTILQSMQTVATITPPVRTETTDSSTELALEDHDIQESKVVPETKIATNNTKTKKKQPQKAISTQIYNFLSREVMPSFGVMSLVGLGLGLASYFLYPFGGAINRRNYEVEPNNYKYSLEEYGGNYGQSEEEVLSKVYQGMTNTDEKYAGKDNYYRYQQQYDGAYDSKTTRRVDQRYPGTVSTSPEYRPLENAYLNTEYQAYTRIPNTESQTTPNYYDRQKHSDFVVGSDVSVSGGGNRQFVVGSVPKEYPAQSDRTPTLPAVAKKVSYETTGADPEQGGLNYNYPQKAVNVPPTYSKVSQTAKPEEGYEEVEITPTAVAVEHGPRSLRIRRSVSGRGARRVRRDSVIQVIPSKKELEEEEKEEPLSNEILDIIDSALPGAPILHENKHKVKKEDNEVEDLEGQKKKQHEEDKTRRKQAAFSTKKPDEKSVQNEVPAIHKISVPNAKDKSDKEASTDSASSSTSDATTINSSSGIGSSGSSSSGTVYEKGAEETTADWFNDLTTKPPPPQEGFNIFSFVKKVAEIKLRLGLTILKHASEGFARYLGHVQKRINGEE
ncbi:uncharacterized protein [Prorops nasuta]|uniref:uncharacterized protein n=1 Tax=Prorops nasuta TaxID=863751 RepID=UPI0034CF8047